jgi:hypothetical protein
LEVRIAGRRSARYSDRVEAIETAKQQGERPKNGAATSMVRSQCVRARGSVTQEASTESIWMIARMRAITSGQQIRSHSPKRAASLRKTL